MSKVSKKPGFSQIKFQNFTSPKEPYLTDKIKSKLTF